MIDLQFLAPLGGFLTVIGGAAVWLFNRADRQREGRENGVIAILKDQNASLKRQVISEQKIAKSRLREGNKWREQLIKNGLTPDPGGWSDLETER